MAEQAVTGQFGAPVRQPASQEEISGTPLWHLYDYDLVDQTFTLVRIEEEIYRKASFLDHRIDSFKLPMVRYEMQHLGQLFPRLDPSRRPLGWIFHIGHCGSTLLSRALSVSENVLPFREPMSLRSLSADRHDLGTPLSLISAEQWNALLHAILLSLSRQFHPQQTNIVKATSTSNNLIAPVLGEDHRQKAILLYLPLENYLATMLGKPRQASDLWAQARKRMKDWLAIDGTARLELHRLQAPQLAALSWLTSMNHMLAARDKFGDRVLLLNFESLLAEPATQLSSATFHLGLDDDAQSIIEQFPQIASGYSKQPNQKYTPEFRARLLQLTRAEQAEGIDSGIEWAHSRIAESPSLQACAELLS